MFRECQEWNRKEISCYKEIFLRVPMEVLLRRDQKQLYSKALLGENKNVMGMDLHADEPVSPDMVIENDGTTRPAELARRIFDQLVTAKYQ